MYGAKCGRDYSMFAVCDPTESMSGCLKSRGSGKQRWSSDSSTC